MKRSSSAHTHLQRADGRWKSVLSACEVVSELRAGNGSAFFRVKEARGTDIGVNSGGTARDLRPEDEVLRAFF